MWKEADSLRKPAVAAPARSFARNIRPEARGTGITFEEFNGPAEYSRYSRKTVGLIGVQPPGFLPAV
jgi:hypothetical protein